MRQTGKRGKNLAQSEETKLHKEFKMKTQLNLQKAATLAGVSMLSAGLSSLALADHNAEDAGVTELDSGYQTVAKAEAEGKCGEGKCGEGKCGSM